MKNCTECGKPLQYLTDNNWYCPNPECLWASWLDTTCPTCQGRGWVDNNDTCYNCGGSGEEEE